jgi:hypothetical protein
MEVDFRGGHLGKPRLSPNHSWTTTLLLIGQPMLRGGGFQREANELSTPLTFDITGFASIEGWQGDTRANVHTYWDDLVHD